jgi:hypothetical protein
MIWQHLCTPGIRCTGTTRTDYASGHAVPGKSKGKTGQTELTKASAFFGITPMHLRGHFRLSCFRCGCTSCLDTGYVSCLYALVCEDVRYTSYLEVGRNPVTDAIR